VTIKDDDFGVRTCTAAAGDAYDIKFIESSEMQYNMHITAV